MEMVKEDWEYNSNKVLCEDCGSNYNILQLKDRFKCFECIDGMKEDDDES